MQASENSWLAGQGRLAARAGRTEKVQKVSGAAAGVADRPAGRAAEGRMMRAKCCWMDLDASVAQLMPAVEMASYESH